MEAAAAASHAVASTPRWLRAAIDSAYDTLFGRYATPRHVTGYHCLASLLTSLAGTSIATQPRQYAIWLPEDSQRCR